VAAVWPASLPSYVAVDGYELDPAPSTYYSETLSGRVRSRRQADSRQDRHVLAFHMSAAQLATFETFWRTTLLQGSLVFQGVNEPFTGAAVVWQPAGRYRVAPLAPTLFRVLVPVVRTADAPFDSQTVSLDLDGSSERLSSSETTVGIADAWTLLAWLKRADSDTIDRRLVEVFAGAGNSNRIILARQTGTADTLEVNAYNSAGALIKNHRFAAQLQRSQWRCIAVAFDGSEASDPLRVYVNAQLLTPTSMPADTTGTMTDTARAIAVGRVGSELAGRIHSLALWSSELAVAEIGSIYYGGRDFNLNAAKNGYQSQASLQHWYRFGHDAAPDADIGKDFAAVPFGTHNLMDAAANVSAADVVTDAPV